MSDKIKELTGTTIEIRNGSIRFIPEDGAYPWWRKQLDRQKEGILCPQIANHMLKVASNLTKKDEQGQRVGKYDVYITNLPPNPKSSQGNMKTKYKRNIISCLEKKKEGLEKFKDKEIFVYVAIYLRPERYKTHDIDNFLKAIIDSLKEYTGDDSKVVCILADKYQLEDYPKEDLDFLEQAFIVVADPKARREIGVE